MAAAAAAAAQAQHLQLHHQLTHSLAHHSNMCEGCGTARTVLDITSSGRRGRLIGSLGYILAVLGRGTGPRGEKMTAASPGTNSHDLATILDPFRAIFADLGPDRLSET